MLLRATGKTQYGRGLRVSTEREVHQSLTHFSKQKNQPELKPDKSSMSPHTAHVTKSVSLSVGAYVSRVRLPLFRLALVLSLKPWLRRFPAAPAEPRGGMSLPAVDILADGPGSLVERKEGGRGEEQDNVYVGCLIYWEHWDTSSPHCQDSDRRVTGTMQRPDRTTL